MDGPSEAEATKIAAPEPTIGRRDRSERLSVMEGDSDTAHIMLMCRGAPFNMSSRYLEHTYVPQKTRTSRTHLKVSSRTRVPRELFMAITLRSCVFE